MTFSNRPKISERGQALVIIAIAIVVLAGLTGLVIDGSNTFLDRRNAQNAADSAALAAALARIRGGQNPTAAALAVAETNGYANDGVSNTVTVHIPPISGPNADDVEYVQVIIVSNVKTYIASIFGWKSFTNEVQAVARSKPSEIRELLHGMAVVSLAPESNCSNEKAFWVHGDATLSISGGGVYVNSKNKDCAFIQQGNGSIQIQGGDGITVVGGVSIQKPQLLTPGVTVGVSGNIYPPPFFMPEVTCEDQVAQVSEDGTTMSPGTWEEKFPPEGVTFLQPGVYCLTDGFDANGSQTIEGTEVVFKVEQGEVKFGGNSNLKLSAPTSGDFKGLLIYLPMENDSQVTLNGGPISTFIGTILAPASEIVINGNSSTTGFQSQIIGYRVNVDGSSKVVITYKNQQNYDAITMPEVQLSQ